MSALAPTVAIDDTELRAQLAAAPGQIRKAMRNALNDTARSIQGLIRANIHDMFEIKRKSWADMAVKIEKAAFATETDVTFPTIGIDPMRDTLAKFERGGLYSAPLGEGRGDADGSRKIMIPTREIRIGRGGHVKPAFALSKFKPFAPASQLRQRRFEGGTSRAFTEPVLAGRMNTWWAKLPSGEWGLFQRTGSRGRGLRLLYVTADAKRIPARLHFERTVRDSAPHLWPLHAVKAVEFALKRAGLK